ncbi:putative F-box/LRR-repeat protein 23 [Salvia divinorum]|uniref:F-box/LRR-repeat protein 23 n=1 Tax=Salvia divinorum TaxID=28513 RepID=A0ABD1GKE7_SALDI
MLSKGTKSEPSKLMFTTWIEWMTCITQLKLSGFRVDDLLYAAERSSQLRCLTLILNHIIETDVTEAIKKLAQLEELHLMTIASLNPKDFETIGIACPMLKSLTYSNFWGGHQEEFSGHAVAIGETHA